MKPNPNLGSGWMLLAASDERVNDLDVLYLLRNLGTPRFFNEIHVPVDMRRRSGELIAISISDFGEKTSIGEGAIVPFDKGIKIISPIDIRKNKLRPQLIHKLSKKLVNLQFILDT